MVEMSGKKGVVSGQIFLQIKLRGKAVVELAPATKHPFCRNDIVSWNIVFIREI